MSIYLFLLKIALLTYVNAQDPIKQYVIKRDAYAGYKAAEYSVYDTSEIRTYYRIESNYGLLQDLELLSYPSKQKVATLKTTLDLLTYKADISILDTQTKQLINGTIQQNLQSSGISFDILWNNQKIFLKADPASYTSKFYGINSELLAQFRLRPTSVFVTNKYDMQIYSNKYPEQIYLLGLAARDNFSSSKTLRKRLLKISSEMEKYLFDE